MSSLSNAGSNAGSRAPSPINFPTTHTDGSLHSSHPETPFSTHIPSPSFSPHPRPGSSTSNHSGIAINSKNGNSPSGFNKPQSPPALVMPNNAPSPSPALPPIITQPAGPASGSGGQGHALTGQIGGMGGLLPPTNPALEHLSGMMGISPIAPNADGPQIFVQPSTPISGLKDGRGHFDAVLRKMGLQTAQQAHQAGGLGQGQGQGQQGADSQQRSRSPSVSAASISGDSSGGYNVPPPNLSGGSGGSAHSSAHAAQAAAHAQARMQLQQDMEWEDLASSSRLGADNASGDGFGGSTRPRAKSDSHMPLAEADRQAMFSYLAQAQLAGVAPDQAVMDSMGPEQRSQIDAWLSSMTMNSPGMGYSQLQQQQQAAGQGTNEGMPTTMNPNQLPGNENNVHAQATSPGLASAAATIASSAPPTARTSFSTPAEELRAKHMQQQRQLELIQAQQRHKLSLNTSIGSQTTVSHSGILKYEPGEFSPTSLAFYQQQGLFPMGGSNVAPLPGGMGLFAASAGGAASAGLHGTFANMASFNPAHISTTASAPYYQTHFPSGAAGGAALPSAALGSMGGAFPHTAAPGGTFLSAGNSDGSMPRRRSFAEGSHPAAGAGTPGYGTALQRPSPMYAGAGGGQSTLSPFGTLDPGRLRGVGAQSAQGHRRAARSEDFGRGGWGVGQGGSTADFLNSITGNDGSLIPPLRGRSMSHGRQSSASSVRSASPALSISSQGSSMSAYHGTGAGYNRMDMPEGQSVPMPMGHPSHSRSNSNTSMHGGAARLAKMKVTSMATEVAATSRRTNDGVFHCPVPGCGSTFTRHFNLKGHMRSHNDERPFKCLYDGCPKAEIGFARQHDCKRHMLLHKGLRPFECDACGKKFARLDALTRHHKSEQGHECAITHPLPVNPDGSAMSESQYKAYKAHEAQMQGVLHPDGQVKQEDDDMMGTGGKKGKGRRKSATSRHNLSASNSASGLSGDEDMGGGTSGMEDYDRI